MVGYWQEANSLLPFNDNTDLLPREFNEVTSKETINKLSVFQEHWEVEEPRKSRRMLQSNALDLPILFVPESKTNDIETPRKL